MASAQDLSAWDKDERLFLFTSLTAGSSHIITATSRLETILKANKVPFVYVDTATNDKARRLWVRRSGGKKLPGLIKDGFVIGDLEEVEEWNEYGELKENIGTVPPANPALPVPGVEPDVPSTGEQAAPAASPAPATTTQAKPDHDKTITVESSLNNLSMKEAASQAATIGAARKGPTPGINDTKVAPSSLAEADAATKPETINSSSAAKIESIRTAEDTATLASNAEKPAGLSAVESNDDLSAVSATPAGSIQKKHRGSSVSNASADEIKEVEQSTAIPEAENEDEEQPNTQAQESAAAEKAPVSVQD